MLTTRQADLLRFLDGCQSEGTRPSVREMQTALGLKSTSGIHRLLDGLEERGWISRSRSHRSVLVLKPVPRNMAMDRTVAVPAVDGGDALTLPRTIAAGRSPFHVVVDDGRLVGMGLMPGDVVVVSSSSPHPDGRILADRGGDGRVRLRAGPPSASTIGHVVGLWRDARDGSGR